MIIKTYVNLLKMPNTLFDSIITNNLYEYDQFWFKSNIAIMNMQEMSHILRKGIFFL